MFRWLTRRGDGALRPSKPAAPARLIVASGPLPDGVHGDEWSGYVWVAVRDEHAHLVQTGEKAHTFHWFVSEVVRIARDDPVLRRVLSEVIDIVYRAREAHPDCTIFVVDTRKKTHDADPDVHHRGLVVRARAQLPEPGRRPPALPDRRPD